MKTLKECFEEAGSKFPFTVKWARGGVIQLDSPVVTIVGNIKSGDGKSGDGDDNFRWLPEAPVGDDAVDMIYDAEMSDTEPMGFYGYADEHHFELTTRPAKQSADEELLQKVIEGAKAVNVLRGRLEVRDRFATEFTLVKDQVTTDYRLANLEAYALARLIGRQFCYLVTDESGLARQAMKAAEAWLEQQKEKK